MADDAGFDLSELTATIVANYVSHNKVEPTKLGEVIADVHRALSNAQAPVQAEPELPKPDKAAIRKSMSDEYLVSFIDGRKYKSLKRHLTTQGMSPDEYRNRFGLPKDYPMVAPNYSAQRSELAKKLGLGRRAPPAPQPPKKGRATAKSKAIKPSDDTFT